jgi:hypothetical protein
MLRTELSGHAAQDRWVRSLERLGVRPDRVEVVVVAVERRFVVGPQCSQRGDTLGERAVAAPPRHRSVVGELLLVPADADAELDTSAAQPVEGRDSLGEREQVTLERERHARAEEQRRRRARRVHQADVRVHHPEVWPWEITSDRVRRPPRRRNVAVLADPQRVEAPLLNLVGDDVGRQLLERVHRREPQPHVASSPRPRNLTLPSSKLPTQ